MVISKKKIIASALALSVLTSMAAISASAAEVTGIQESNPYANTTSVVDGLRTVVASAPKVNSFVYDGGKDTSYKVTSSSVKNNIITLNTKQYTGNEYKGYKATGKTKKFTLEKGIARNFVFGATLHNANANKITTYVSLRGNKSGSTINPGNTTAVLNKYATYSVTNGYKVTRYTGTADIIAYDINNKVKTYKVTINYWEEYESSAKTVAATPYAGYTKKALVGNTKVNLQKDGTFERLSTGAVTRIISLQ